MLSVAQARSVTVGGIAFQVAAFAAVLVALVAMVASGLEVGIALLAAGTALVLALNPSALPQAAMLTTSDEVTWFLVAMSALITLLAEAYRKTGLITELGYGISRALRSPKLSVVLVPAVIGLLPVAGGALMSAPVIEALSVAAGLSAAGAVAANVWFRHMLFLFYPLSDIVILASSLSGVSVETIVARQLPVAAALIALGYAALLGGKRGTSEEMEYRGTSDSLLTAALPMLVALAAAMALRYAISPLLMPLGVAVGIVAVALSPNGFRALAESVRERRVYAIALAAFAAMYMRYSLELSGAAGALTALLSSAGYLLLFAVAVPFLLGFAAGSVPVALTVGISMLHGVNAVSAFMVNAVYMAAFLGYLGSPAHLCFTYTAEYFSVPLSKPYRRLAPLVLISLPLSVAILALVDAVAREHSFASGAWT